MCKISKNPKVREAQNCRQLLINARLSAAYNSWCHLDVKKTCYPNPVKINTICVSKKQMQYACNNELKRVLTTCTKQRLRIFNGTDY